MKAQACSRQSELYNESEKFFYMVCFKKRKVDSENIINNNQEWTDSQATSSGSLKPVCLL